MKKKSSDFFVNTIYLLDFVGIFIVGQPLPQPQLQPQLELEAKEAINSMDDFFLSPTINLPLNLGCMLI